MSDGVGTLADTMRALMWQRQVCNGLALVRFGARYHTDRERQHQRQGEDNANLS